MTDTAQPPQRSPLRVRGRGRWADPAFRWLVTAAGVSVLAVLAAMIGSTGADAGSVFAYQGIRDFFFGTEWEAGFSRFEFTGTYGAWPFIYGTLLVSAIAISIAVPLALVVALFITQVAPKRTRNLLSYTVEMLAAVPSVVIGLWGLLWFIPTFVLPVFRWMATTFGDSFFLLQGPVANVSYAAAGLVLSFMILPIITAITREVIAVTPEDQRFAGYALGATRWEVMRKIVLRRSAPGIIGATMLGLGRALGETIAVAFLVGSSQRWAGRVFFPGDTMAAHIATTFADAAPETVTALIAVGVALFIITILVNVSARLIVWRMGNLAGGGAL